MTSINKLVAATAPVNAVSDIGRNFSLRMTKIPQNRPQTMRSAMSANFHHPWLGGQSTTLDATIS